MEEREWISDAELPMHRVISPFNLRAHTLPFSDLDNDNRMRVNSTLYFFQDTF